MGDPLSTTEYPRGTPPSLPATAGTVFLDPDFGSEMVRLTVPTDGNQATLMISTTSPFNRDSTRVGPVLCPNYPVTDGNRFYVYHFDPVTMAVSGRTFLNGSPFPSMDYVMWDWSSEATKYMLNGVRGALNDSGREVVAYDTSTLAVTVIKNFLSKVQLTGLVSAKSTNTQFTMNWTLPEDITDAVKGMTLSNLTNGTGPVSIISYAIGGAIVVASGLTVTVGDTLQLNWVGLGGLYEVTPDGRYHSWACGEGHADRGLGVQDVGRTLLWWDKNNPTVIKRKFVTAAETGQLITEGVPKLTIGGIHAQNLDKNGRYVVFSYTGGMSESNLSWIWDPLASNPDPKTGDGTLSRFTHAQHRDMGYTNFVQGDYYSGSPDIMWLRPFSTLAETVAWSLPLKSGQRGWCCSSQYISWSHDSADYVYVTLLYNVQTLGWVAGVKANVYKVANWAASNGHCGLDATQNPEGRHNGRRLTFMGSASGQTATEALLTAAGQFAWDTSTSSVYVWGFDNANLLTDTSAGGAGQGADVVAFAQPDAANNTVRTFKTNLTSAVTDRYKGRVIYFDPSGFGNVTRRITGYNATTKFITVDADLHTIPTTQFFYIQRHAIHLWDWRVGANELVQVWMNEPSNTLKHRRICHLHSFVTEGTYDLGVKGSSNKDGTLVAFESAWGGDTRRDVIVVRATVTDPSGTVGVPPQAGAASLAFGGVGGGLGFGIIPATP